MKIHQLLFCFFFMAVNSLFGQTTADTVICEQWAQIFSLSDSLIEGGTIIDAKGNIYVGGISKIDGATGGNILLLKYDKTGQLLWNRMYNVPYSDPSKPLPKMQTDTQGNVFFGFDQGIIIPGIEGAPDTYTTDFAVLKYDSSGTQQWVANYDGGNADNLIAMTMDESGNIFAAGSSNNALGNSQVTTVKFNANGSPQWTTTLNVPAILSSVAKSIAIKNGNIYVGGQCTTPTGITRYILIKYNSLGVQQWMQQYSNGMNAAGEKIVIDGNENISILGNVTLPTGTILVTTVKYDSNGNQLWTVSYTSPTDGARKGTGIKLDNAGNSYWFVNNRNSGYEIVKYNPSGVQQWIANHSPLTAPELPSGNSFILDSAGNSYVIWSDFSQTSSFDIITNKYDSDGNMIFEKTYDNDNNMEGGIAIALSPENDIYLTGITITGGNNWNVVTVKYGTCQQPCSLTVDITPSGPTTFCQGGNVTLSATAGNSFLWSTGEITQDITVTTSGNYIVTVTDGNGCSATSTPTEVTVNPLPVADAGQDATILAGQRVQIGSAPGLGNTFIWSPITGLNDPNMANPIASPTITRKYLLAVTNIGGCVAVDSIIIFTFNSFVDSLGNYHQAPDTFINGNRYSNLITLQFQNNSVIPTTYLSQTVLGTNNINQGFPYIRNTIDNCINQIGGSISEVSFKRIGIDSILSSNLLNNIFEVQFPVFVNVDSLAINLRQDATVKFACPPFNIASLGIPYGDPGNNPGFPNWHINQIHAPESWVFLQTAQSQAVGILESPDCPGVGSSRASATHPELLGQISNAPYTAAFTCSPGESNHATEVASVISANNNISGSVGVGFNTARVCSYSFFCDNFYWDFFSEFVSTTVQNGTYPRFLNLSWAFYLSIQDPNGFNYNHEAPWSNVGVAIQPFIALMNPPNNVMIFASTGNSMGMNGCNGLGCIGPFFNLVHRGIGYPFGLPGVIGIGATNINSGIVTGGIFQTPFEHGMGSGLAGLGINTSGNNYNYNFNDPNNADPVDQIRDNDGYLEFTAGGAFIDVAGINCTTSQNNFSSSSGTSFASPAAAAVAACMASVNTTLSNQVIIDIMRNTTDKVLYNPNGLTFNQLNGNTSYSVGYQYNNGGLPNGFNDINLDWVMGYGRINMLSAVMNAAGLLTPNGFTVDNTLPFHIVTVNNVNDHSYLYSTVLYGNFNEAWEYDAVLNQVGADITFDGNGSTFELATNSTFRVSNGASMHFQNDANLLIQPGTNVNGQGTRCVIENGGTVELISDANFQIPSAALFEVQNAGNLIIDNNTNLVVQSGGTLVIRAGANVTLTGNSQIIVQNGGYVCIEDLANIILQDAGSIIDFQATCLFGSNPILMITTNCVCPYDIAFNGNGDIN